MATLTAFVDLAVVPVSFDVVPFLVRAQMEADARRCNELHVVIVPHKAGVAGMFRDKLHLYDAAEMQFRLWNLVVPACHLIGASVTVATGWEQARKLATPQVWPDNWDSQTLADRPYYVGPIVSAAREGIAVPRLHASKAARRAVRARFKACGKPVVTMTLRDTYEPGRNSDRREWMAAARILEQHGLQVVIVDDTSIALESGVGQAEISLDVRMAMYESASMNVIGNAGPAQLLWFSTAPFIEIGAAEPRAHWGEFWKKHHLLDADKNDQLPWARWDQRLVYEEPSTDWIVREVSDWLITRRTAA
jgi:hypothetical protein